jgi:hypothetical protein
MASKPDISTKLSPWDSYKQKKPEEAAGTIYQHIADTSTMICTWYWTSIRSKKSTSLVARALAFAGLVAGTALPIFAALQKEDTAKLMFTQWGVGLLATSGLLLVADRVFGWSSGWMRYITTVTTMENLTRAFQLEWGRLLLTKSTPLDLSDAKSLYELAASLEQELVKLQAEETTKWCAEFNTGISLLEAMIKSQREETDKKLDAIRTSLSTQQKTIAADEKANRPGAIEATLSHKAEPKTVHVSLDTETPSAFVGTVWSRSPVEPGIHILHVRTADNPPIVAQRAIEVGPSAVARVEIKMT